ncbi:hypothetical protein [Alteribacter lacisalsi]|nr:hypothetical protein [Alteribacter lacisalsi]
MIFTLFRYTVSIEKQPYTERDIEKECAYQRRCRQVDQQRNRQAEMYRIL